VPLADDVDEFHIVASSGSSSIRSMMVFGPA
jgi:hypothetical protein